MHALTEESFVTTSTVLVADDDAGIRTVIGQALERVGYQVA